MKTGAVALPTASMQCRLFSQVNISWLALSLTKNWNGLSSTSLRPLRPSQPRFAEPRPLRGLSVPLVLKTLRGLCKFLEGKHIRPNAIYNSEAKPSLLSSATGEDARGDNFAMPSLRLLYEHRNEDRIRRPIFRFNDNPIGMEPNRQAILAGGLSVLHGNGS